MGFRITTNGLFRNYRAGLQRSTKNLNSAMHKVETHRKFSHYAEDPAAASQAFQLRRAYWRAENQKTNSEYVISKFQTGWSAIQKLVDGNDNQPGLDGIASSLELLNDPTGGARRALGQDLLSTTDGIMQCMNVKYGDTFVFAGNDGLNCPFSWDGDKLLYRGLDVSNPLLVNDDSGVVSVMSQADYLAKNDGATAADYNKLKTDAEKLLSMSAKSSSYKGAMYVDIGLGMKEDNTGKFIASSGYDSALSGIDFLGFGVDEDGEPKNLAVIMKKLGNIASNCDANTGEFKDVSYDYVAELQGKLQSALSYTSRQHVELDGRANYLKTNLEMLNSNTDLLNEQIVDIEDIDPADAITEMLYAQYCYNAALKIGPNILSDSLIDYMR